MNFAFFVDFNEFFFFVYFLIGKQQRSPTEALSPTPSRREKVSHNRAALALNPKSPNSVSSANNSMLKLPPNVDGGRYSPTNPFINPTSSTSISSSTTSTTNGNNRTADFGGKTGKNQARLMVPDSQFAELFGPPIHYNGKSNSGNGNSSTAAGISNRTKNKVSFFYLAG